MRIAPLIACCYALTLALPSAAADRPTCQLPQAPAATCIHVDRDGTAGQWTLWHLADSTAVRDRIYPEADGGPVPGLDPGYRWLLQLRIDPPEIDTRFQQVVYPCPATPDLAAGTITTVCTASVRPPADILTAVGNAAQQRITEAMDALDLRDPADQIRALGLLQAARRGAALTAAQEAWLDALGDAGIDYVDSVRVVEAAIVAWVAAHPGQIPDVGAGVWPPLPVVAP